MRCIFRDLLLSEAYKRVPNSAQINSNRQGLVHNKRCCNVNFTVRRPGCIFNNTYKNRKNIEM